MIDERAKCKFEQGISISIRAKIFSWKFHKNLFIYISNVLFSIFWNRIQKKSILSNLNEKSCILGTCLCWNNHFRFISRKFPFIKRKNKRILCTKMLIVHLTVIVLIPTNAFVRSTIRYEPGSFSFRSGARLIKRK